MDDFEELQENLGLLTPIERTILTLRFGLNGERVHSLYEVRRLLDLDDWQLRQHEAAALKKLRRGRRT